MRTTTARLFSGAETRRNPAAERAGISRRQVPILGSAAAGFDLRDVLDVLAAIRLFGLRIQVERAEGLGWVFQAESDQLVLVDDLVGLAVGVVVALDLHQILADLRIE